MLHRATRMRTNQYLPGMHWLSGLEAMCGHCNPWCVPVISQKLDPPKGCALFILYHPSYTKSHKTSNQTIHESNPGGKNGVESEVFSNQTKYLTPVYSGKIQTLQMQVILLCLLTIRQSDQEGNVHLKRRGFDHKARPSFRNENLIDLCTAAPFTAAVFVGFSFSASLINMIGLESATLVSLALSENNSSP